MYVQRFDTKTIPDDEEGASEWLQELFRKKDRMQDNFHNHGNFFHGLDMEPIEPIIFKPRLSCLLNTLGWLLFTLSFMLYYLAGLLLSGNFLYFSIGIGVLFICKCAIFFYLLNLLTYNISFKKKIF